jgi:hypothetical protein
MTPFFARKQAGGPEVRALRGKSIDGKRISPGDPAMLPLNGAGPSGLRIVDCGMRIENKTLKNSKSEV